MTFPDISLGHILGRKSLLLLALLLGMPMVIGVIAAREPVLAIGGVLVVLLAFASLVWPDAPTLAVLFMLYTNAAVVAVQFHGVPFIIGASLPLLLVVPFVNFLIIRRQKMIVDATVMLLVLFLAVQLVGTLRAVHTGDAFDEVITFAIEALGIYFLVINSVRTPKMVRLATWVLIIAGLLMGALSSYQQITATFDNNYAGFAQVSNAAFGTGEETLLGEVTQPRLGGPLGQQNRYAQIMLTLVPLALFRYWGERNLALRALAAAATILILAGAMLTFSRGAVVGFALMLVIMTLMRYIKLNQLMLILLVLVLLMQAFPQFGTRLSSLETLSSAISDEGSTGLGGVDSSSKSRVTEMLAAALMFADHPFVGVGPGMYPHHYHDYAKVVGIKVKETARQPHTLYLGLAAENGALGLICFALIVSVILRRLARTYRDWIDSRPGFANMAMGFILAIVVYLMTGIFLHFAYIRYFWLIVGLAAALTHIGTQQASAETALREYAMLDSSRPTSYRAAEKDVRLGS